MRAGARAGAGAGAVAGEGGRRSGVEQSEVLPFAEDRVLDGVHVLRGHPVQPVAGGLRGPELNAHDVVLLVAVYGLADDALDGAHGELLRSLLGAEPQLVLFQLEGQSQLATVLVEHATERDPRQGFLNTHTQVTADRAAEHP